MKSRVLVFASALAITGLQPLFAQDSMQPLQGRCSIAPADMPDRVRLKLEQEACDDGARHCSQHESDDMPLGDFSGITADDFQREGAHIDAVIAAEAGKITCSGPVHDGMLSGDYRFVPDAAFLQRMGQMGFSGFTPELLEAYTLFHIESAWVQSLQSAGVTGMSTDKILALRIFKADASYVRNMAALGYANLPADKLIAFRVHGVNPDEIRQYRALGYQPDENELIQMRIFKVTPDFIQRMGARGFGKLTISKLVQIRIFNLAD